METPNPNAVPPVEVAPAASHETNWLKKNWMLLLLAVALLGLGAYMLMPATPTTTPITTAPAPAPKAPAPAPAPKAPAPAPAPKAAAPAAGDSTVEDAGKKTDDSGPSRIVEYSIPDGEE